MANREVDGIPLQADEPLTQAELEAVLLEAGAGPARSISYGGRMPEVARSSSVPTAVSGELIVDDARVLRTRGHLSLLTGEPSEEVKRLIDRALGTETAPDDAA